jgi:hypothetical protein
MNDAYRRKVSGHPCVAASGGWTWPAITLDYNQSKAYDTGGWCKKRDVRLLMLEFDREKKIAACSFLDSTYISLSIFHTSYLASIYTSPSLYIPCIISCV